MEDFNNIEFDPIPEGLEFNESYMQDAFALYDAEKQKQRRRILIWWLTSALGFASILLVGIYFLSKGDASETADQKAAAGKNLSAQNLSLKNPDSSDRSNNQTGTISTTADSNPNQQGNNEMLSKKRTTTKFVSSVSQKNDPAIENKSKQNFRAEQALTQFKVPGKSRSSFTTKRVEKGNIPSSNNTLNENSVDETSKTPDPARPLALNVISPDNTDQIAETDSSHYPDLNNLPSKPALLAFNEDSISERTINSLGGSLQKEVEPLKHQLFLNLGVNTMFGMKELQHRVIFKESIGLSYNYQVSRKIGIGVGMEYHAIPRISYRRIVGDTNNSSKTTTILNKTTLNYISLFPQVNFQLWPHHKLTAGLGIEYLLVDPGERYEIDNYTDESPKRTNSKLYYSTFNRFNFSISVGYVYQFSRFMSVQALYHYGFTDITKSNGFNQTFDRNSRLQLGVKIKLL